MVSTACWENYTQWAISNTAGSRARPNGFILPATTQVLHIRIVVVPVADPLVLVDSRKVKKRTVLTLFSIAVALAGHSQPTLCWTALKLRPCCRTHFFFFTSKSGFNNSHIFKKPKTHTHTHWLRERKPGNRRTQTQTHTHTHTLWNKEIIIISDWIWSMLWHLGYMLKWS